MISIPCYATETMNLLHTKRSRLSALVMTNIHVNIVFADESWTLTNVSLFPCIIPCDPIALRGLSS